MPFERLGLAPVLTKTLAKLGHEKPTPIQSEAIPIVLDGHDLLAGAQTGTGKTAAFALPILQQLVCSRPRKKLVPRRPQALVLTPTRELAAQVQDSFRSYGKETGLRSAVIFGGVGFQPQVQAMRQGVNVAVATPGRLLDHMEQGTMELEGLDVLVLDEADRMLDMGFLPALRQILKAVPRQRQTLLFSATLGKEIRSLAQQFTQGPAEVQIAPPNQVVATVRHRVHPVVKTRKRDLLLHILAKDDRVQALVFCRTKYGSDKLCRHLLSYGFRAAAIHGNKTQGARTRALDDFKSGKVTVLVATDIAARGLDIHQLPMVINFDLPLVAEDYIHRIGRTGRAGAEGQAISLVSEAEEGLLRDIQRLLKRDIVIERLEKFDTPKRPLNVRPPGRDSQDRGHSSSRPSNGFRRAKAKAKAKKARSAAGSRPGAKPPATGSSKSKRKSSSKRRSRAPGRPAGIAGRA